MNRFTSDGIIAEALTGKRVLVLDQTAMVCHGSFRDVRERVEHHGLECNTWMSSGREKIAFGIGGSIAFRSIQSNLRGLAYDIVLVNHLRDRRLLEKVYLSGDLHSLVRFTEGELVVE